MSADYRHYASRLFSRAWKETGIKWDLYRWWMSVSGILFTLVVAISRKGWIVLVSLQEVAVNAAGGLVLAFVGSWAISLVRSFKLLDDDRAAEVATANAALAESQRGGEMLKAENAELKKPKRERHQQIKYDEASSEIQGLSAPELVFIRALIGRGEFKFEDFHQDLIRNHGMAESDFSQAVVRFRSQRVHLVQFIGPSALRSNNFIQVNPHYLDALVEILN